QVTGADHYQLQVSLFNDFISNIFDQAGIALTTSQVPGLENNTHYYWRVRAANPAGEGQWSQIWSFTTLAAGEPLVGHWKMDEGTGTALADASTYGNHAQITGEASWVPGINGQAIRFNGTGQFAAAPDHASLDITGAITLAAWVKPETTKNQYLIK